MLGITWGLEHHRLYGSPDAAMTIGRFIFAGCIDAPDRIPAGSCRVEWWPEVEDFVPLMTEIQREGTEEDG